MKRLLLVVLPIVIVTGLLFVSCAEPEPEPPAPAEPAKPAEPAAPLEMYRPPEFVDLAYESLTKFN